MINIAESDKGRLYAVDLTALPFIPKRLFVVDNVPHGETRSDHAHIKDHQMLFCLKGSLSIELTTPTLNKTILNLISGEKLYLPNLIWSKIKFIEPNSSFMCVCSETYDELEYIRDYNQFLNLTKQYRNEHIST